MPYKKKEDKAAQMRGYRKKKKAKLEQAKKELAKPHPSVPKLRNLLGVKVRPVDLVGKKHRRSKK